MSKTRKPFVDFRAIRERLTMEQVLEHYGVLHALKRKGNRCRQWKNGEFTLR